LPVLEKFGCVMVEFNFECRRPKRRGHVMNSNQTNPNKALWEKGDFTRIAASMKESGEALAKSLGITKGLKVLDLGCGDGTTALPAARLGADVLGVERCIVPARHLYVQLCRDAHRIL
jgi:2-polyprenyl-3-methyl-5-hydroxy-6-metoxy-1,4-benzoquinol methylase